MRFKRTLAALVAGLCLVPAAASAQVTLSASGQQQLTSLTTQLVGILTALSQAQAEGSAYTSSPAFVAQAGVWSQQVTQIGQQLVTLLSSAAQTSQTTPTSIPTMGGTTNTCPSFTRDLDLGMQGSDVAALQLFLSTDHFGQFTEGVNGYFDAATLSAVQRYQAGYGIVSSGAPSTTGFGHVGPGTRISISAVCARGSYVISVPPITVPTTGPNGIASTPPPTPPAPPASPPTPQVGYSTAQLILIPSLTGKSGGPTSVGFSVNMLPNSVCSAATFVLSFGDGNQQNLTSTASCGNQIQTITHVYPNTGQYTATLTSGPFSTSLPVNIQVANNSIGLTASADPNTSLGGVIVATYNPGVTCVAGTYTVSFGDGVTQNISFNSGCITQTQSINHTFAHATSYLISVADATGHTIATSFTPVAK